MVPAPNGPYRTAPLRTGPRRRPLGLAVAAAAAGLGFGGLIVGAVCHVVMFDDGGPALQALCTAIPPGGRFDSDQWRTSASEASLETDESFMSNGVDAGVTTYRAIGGGMIATRPVCHVSVREKTVIGYEAWSYSSGHVNHSIVP